MTKGLGKYIAALYYFDRVLIVFSAISNGVYITSLATVIGWPVGISRARFSFAFSMTYKDHKETIKNNTK